jgi:hypothetical protein
MKPLSIAFVVASLGSVWAQVQPPPAPWRGAGAIPCVGSDGGIFTCPPAARTTAIRAGHLFDSKTGQMSSKQVILLSGDRITGPSDLARHVIP